MAERKETTQDIVDALAGVFYMFAADGRLLRWNRYLSEISGYCDEELSTMRVQDLLLKKDAERAEGLYRDLLEEEHVDAMATLVSKDGRHLPFHFRSSMFRNVAGEPYAVCGIGSDITARLELEEALRKSERYYRSLIENSFDAIIVLDGGGRMRYVSPSFARMVGRSPRELTGMNALDLVHPEDAARMAEAFSVGIREPYIAIDDEWRYRHVDGTWHFLEAVGRNLLEDESVQGVVINCHDTTYRHKAEEALRESEEKFRTIADNAGDAIVMIDGEATVVYWNASSRKLFGYRAEEAMGKPLSGLIMPDSAHESFHEAVSHLARRNELGPIIKTREVVGRKRDGSSLEVEVSLSSLLVGGRWHALGIVRDISERKSREEILRAANRELETFARNLSHDLRAPLAGAYGYAGVLRRWGEERLDDKAMGWVNEILAGLRRMEGLISAILDYARAGVPAGKSARVDPNKLVHEVLKGLETRMREEGAEVSLEGELPAVEADGTRLFQVLSNLLDNAIKFRRDDVAPRVEIWAERDGDMVLFRVRDNGIGLQGEELQSIFDPFVRRHEDAGKPGSGVGLSIVKQAVRGWEGQVWADSSPGGGTTFFFTVPAAD